MKESELEDPTEADPALTASADLSPNTAKPISLFRGTSVVAALTLVSRVLGFVRDALVARLFGASAYADAFFVAFRIPNLLRSLVAEGALTSAFVPVFNDELRKSKKAASQAMAGIAIVLSGVCTVLAITGIMFSEKLVTFFAPGFVKDPAQLLLASGMLRIMLPMILFVAIVALVNGALNSVGIFGSGAWAQIVMNFSLIIGALIAALYRAEQAAYLLSFSVVAGAILQVIVQLPALRRAGFSFSAKNIAWGPVSAVFRLLPPAILGATVYQLQIFIITVMASLCGAGAVSWMFYADRIVQLPVGVYTIALSSVLLAVLSKARAEADGVTFSRELNKALSLSVFLLLPLSAGLAFYAEPIVTLLFVRGAFTVADAQHTAAVVAVSSLALLPVSLHSIFSRVFIAHKDTVTTTVVGIATLLITLICALSLIGKISPESSGTASLLASLQVYIPQFGALGVLGLSWASVAASTCSCLLLGTLLAARYGVTYRSLMAPILRSALASGIFLWLSFASFKYLPLTGGALTLFALLISSSGWLVAHWFQNGSEVLLLKRSARKISSRK